jgi:uncharacterized protein involved in type VI secretion and phage assembly
MPPVAGLVQAPKIEVEGRALSSTLFDLLAEARVELSYGAASRFQLRFYDHQTDPQAPPISELFSKASLKVGAAVTMNFDDESGSSVKVLKGVITSLAVDLDLGERHFTVSGYDLRNKLGADRNVRTFANQSYEDVLKQIASSSGLSPQIDSSLGTTKYAHLIQVGSDIEFVADIARRTGMEWYVDDDKLVIAPRTSGTTLKLEGGRNLRSFSARYSSTDHPTEAKVTGWDATKKQAIVGTDTSSPKSPSSTVPVESTSRPTAKRTASSWGTTVSSVEEATALAKGLGRRMSAADLVGRGESVGNPAIKPGITCDITGLGDDWNGKYFVTSVEHVYARGDFVTRFTVGSSESTGLLDVLGGSPARLAGGLTTGVTIGVVTNNWDDKDKVGHHVKVKLPYLGDKIESTWARVATIGAGAKRGMAFLPEVDDEVLVAFEHGDLQRPYVIGSLWNGKDAIPLARSDAEARKKRSIVSKAGHQLTFYDGSGDDKNNVTIELADGKTKVFIGQDKIEIIANNGKPIEVKNDKASVVLAASGDITLKGEKISIDAKQDVEIKGMNVKITSNAKTSVAATGQLELKSTAPAKLESTAILELKGTMVKVN